MPYKGWYRLTYGAGIAILLLLVIYTSAVWSDEDEAEEGVADDAVAEEVVAEPTYMEQYTGADADYSGSDMCTMCHSDMIPASMLTHAGYIDGDPDNKDYGYGCEGCHGPGGNHMGNVLGTLHPAKMPPDEVTKLCTNCHSSLRTFELDGWYVSEHNYQGMSCLVCHSGHSESENFMAGDSSPELCYLCHTDEKAMFRMRSHHPVNEGQVGCESCHNPHSGENSYLLNSERDDLCFTCHTDKRGPFIYDHPVSMTSGGDGCFSCHFAHGSNADSLLRLPTRVCQQCHTDRGFDNHFTGTTCWTSGCHENIHGSNTHPLFFD